MYQDTINLIKSYKDIQKQLESDIMLQYNKYGTVNQGNYVALNHVKSALVDLYAQLGL